jgi:hypothetical protein
VRIGDYGVLAEKRHVARRPGHVVDVPQGVGRLTPIGATPAIAAARAPAAIA